MYMDDQLHFIKKIFWIVIFNLSIAFQLFSQNNNLVTNPGFEQYNPLLIQTAGKNTVLFKQTVNGWDVGGSHVMYCNCNIKNQFSYKYVTDCKENIAKSTNACGYATLDFSPDCPDQINPPFYGCSSFISTKLLSTLIPGKAYHFSMQVFIPEQEIIDTLFPYQIGVKFTNNAPNCVLNTMPLIPNGLLRSFKKNEWFNYDFDFIPTCFINYLTIGTFRGANFPTLFHIKPAFSNQFNVDNVTLTLEENRISTANYLECIPDENADFENEKLIVYFNNNESNLLENTKSKIDSFSRILKIERANIWEISGHTDNRGNENYTLSQNRMLEVLNYLHLKFKIPISQFDTVSMSSLQAMVSNNTEENRMKNRRVEIKKIDQEVVIRLFNKSIKPIKKEDLNTVFNNIGYFANSKSSLKSGVFAGLSNLQLNFTTSQGKQIKKIIKNSYREMQNPALAFKIDSLYGIWMESYFKDGIPTYSLNNGEKLRGWLPINFLNKKMDPIDKNRCKLIYSQVHRILDENIPTVDEVGKFTSLVPYLILSTEEGFKLEKYLPSIIKNCSEGLFYWQYYTFLYDYAALINLEKPLYNSIKDSNDFQQKYRNFLNKVDKNASNPTDDWLLKYVNH